jgi:hypothetical protein
MFLKSHVEVPRDFEDVRAAMVCGCGGWLDGLAEAAGAHGVTLLLDVGLAAGARSTHAGTRLELGAPVTTDRLAMVPLHLMVEDGDRLPRMDGSLDAAWLGAGRTHLALSVHYEPPPDLAGRATDRALLHRVAEAVAQVLLARLADRLTAI